MCVLVPNLQGTDCGSPHQSLQKPQPAPGLTCPSAPSDPRGQSAPPTKTHYSKALNSTTREKTAFRGRLNVPYFFNTQQHCF